MNSGKFNKKIEIWGKSEDKNKSEVKNRLGENKLKENILAKPWANISPRTGSLMGGRPADTILSKTTHVIRIRNKAFPDLSIENWIMYKDHRFEIDYVLDPEFKGEFLDAYVTELV